jgi:CO/xanthine dehydrogenase FAD-binding subunit
VIHHVSIERPPPNASSILMRLGNRRGMAVSVASVALLLRLGKDKVVDEARIALGAVAPTAIRCPRAEALLRGEPLSQTLMEEAAQTAAAECSPIDDVRATAGYRRNAVAELVGRGLRTLAARM